MTHSLRNTDLYYILTLLRFPQLQFEYKDPEKNFDRRSVHGLVANLVTIPDPGNATALEVAAGGKVSKSKNIGLSSR